MFLMPRSRTRSVRVLVEKRRGNVTKMTPGGVTHLFKLDPLVTVRTHTGVFSSYVRAWGVSVPLKVYLDSSSSRYTYITSFFAKRCEAGAGAARDGALSVMCPSYSRTQPASKGRNN